MKLRMLSITREFRVIHSTSFISPHSFDLTNLKKKLTYLLREWRWFQKIQIYKFTAKKEIQWVKT